MTSSRSAKRTLAAFCLACLTALGLWFVNLQWLFPDFNLRHLESFTPYYPGMDNLERHEIFDPRYAGHKKILLLGESSTYSIGCDASWSYPDPQRTPSRNGHYSCRIDHLLQQMLHENGHTDWRVFNVASDGAVMLQLYTYVRVSDVKPDIVIEGGGRHFSNRNADWEVLTEKPYRSSFLDRYFLAKPDLRPDWESLKDVLARHGWVDRSVLEARTDVDVVPYRKVGFFNVYMLLGAVLKKTHGLRLVDEPPLPIKIYPFKEVSTAPGMMAPPTEPYDMGYTLANKLMAEMQIRDGHVFLVYQSPRFEMRGRLDWDEKFSIPYATALARHGIPSFDLTDYPMEMMVDNYDNGHHTIDGNRKIAKELYDYLVGNNYLQ